MKESGTTQSSLIAHASWRPGRGVPDGPALTASPRLPIPMLWQEEFGRPPSISLCWVELVRTDTAIDAPPDIPAQAAWSQTRHLRRQRWQHGFEIGLQ